MVGSSRRTLAYRLALAAATAEIARRFRSEKVSWVLLKGPSLAQWLYPEGGRHYGDIDILIPESEFERARALLTSLGYRETRPVRTKRRSGTATVLTRERDAARIDLQVGLRGAGASPDHQWRLLSRDTPTIRVADEDVRVLARPAMAAYTATHAAQHGASEKTLEDLSRALKVESLDGWRSALEVVKEIDALEFFSQGLRLLPEGQEVADKLDLPDVVKTELLLRFGPNRSARTIDAFVRASWADRARLIAELVLPARQVMLEAYPFARRGPLGLVAAYLWRPFALVGRTVRALPEWWNARREARDRRKVDLSEGPS